MNLRNALPRLSLLPFLFLAACDSGSAPGTSGGGGSGADGSVTNVDGGGTTASDGSVASGGDGGVAPDGSFRIVGYYAGWSTYTRDFQVAELPADRMTHVNYAFANVQGGKCVLGDAWADVQKVFPGDTWDDSSANRAGNFGALRRLKAANPSLRTLISVGGWTWSTQFSDVASTASGRAAFASSCVDFMVAYGFDGIDIDWEYPVGGGLAGNANRPEDKANYTLLLAALRAELDARRMTLARAEPFLLTIAAPAGPAIIDHLDPVGIAASVDWINVMSYDFHGAWENVTGHNAPLHQGTGDANVGWNVEAALHAYLDRGVPPSKLVMGVPFYGRSWQGVSAGTTSGLYRSATGAGPGTWENGVLDYADIAAHYVGKPGWSALRDATAGVPYLYNASSGVFVTYDDATSLRAKRSLAGALGLGGLMVWEMSADDASHTLLDALR